jgi:hypothetical protein
MLRHNLEKCLTSPTVPGTSLPFTDLWGLKETLTKYQDQTGKQPQQYFHLLDNSQTLVSPFTLYKKSFPQLGGFQKTHSEFTVNNSRQRVTLQDYVSLVKLLQPDLAVAPLEDFDAQASGFKKISRVVKHSILAFEDIKAMEKQTHWVAPVVIEEPKMLQAVAETTPVMMYGGQSLNSSALYDALREICVSSQLKQKGLAYGDPTSLILGILAGIDFFETDYPLDLA